MYDKRKGIIALVMLLGVTSMTACSSKDTQNVSASDAFAYKVSIDGEQVEISEDDGDVTSLKEVTQTFLTAMLTRDYRNLDLSKENEFYTEEKKKANEASGAEEAALAALNQYKLVQELDKVDIKNIEFFNLYGEKAAKAVTTIYGAVTEGTDEYFASLGFAKNEKYKRNIEIIYLLEDGEWKVSTYTATAREVA